MWKLAVDQLKGPLKEYTKKISPIYLDHGKIVFKEKPYTRKKMITFKKAYNLLDKDEKDHIYLEDLETWKVMDVNKYSKEELQQKVKEFLEVNDIQKLGKRIKGLKMSEKFIESLKILPQHEYTEEYMVALHQYKQKKPWKK